ncbi:MAG: hypothetical protein MUO53_15120 [Maribacter sp.]|nr:hypothetical protein [Maribacter sp.]
MLFKKNKELVDHELGLLWARTYMLQSSTVVWQKTHEFLGNDSVIKISGTTKKLNQEERLILVEAFKKNSILERQVLEVIKGFCMKNGVSFDAWRDYFKCSHIYSNNKILYISIDDHLKKLTYEVELANFGN